MGRRFPATDINSLHPLLSFTLLAVGIAAALTVIAGLCGVRPRRRLRKSPPLSPAWSPTTKPIEKTRDSLEEDQNDAVVGSAAEVPLSLPPPPAAKQLVRESYSCGDMARSDRGKISTSMKVVPRSLSMARLSNRDRECLTNKTKNMEHQDSIWMKTIILGEKCKVPDQHDDRDDDEEDNGVIYEGFNGVKITAYHPRTASSMSISRQCSFTDRDPISRVI